MTYDTEALKRLDISDVIVKLGGEEIKNGKMFRCFNKSFHFNNDKSPSMSVKRGSNKCRCFTCGVGGDPIAIATTALGDFKSACEWLSTTFGIAYLNSNELPKSKIILPKTKVKKVEYLEFDKTKRFKEIDIDKWIEKYNEMTISQKLKMVYSYIYRYSLKTEQTEKLNYYRSRGIVVEHKHFSKIGYLSKEDLKDMLNQLEQKFPLEDLIKFKLLNDEKSKFPLQWKYGKGELIVVPSFDIYTNMTTGLMLRPTKKQDWMPKEFQISCNEIADAFPFAMSYEMFADNGCDNTIYFTEGHIDGLSLLNKCFVAMPGVHGGHIEWFGLFRGKRCVIAFDADKAGLEAAPILKDKLERAGVQQVEILTWDPSLGKDINELLKSGFLQNIL